jgi:uroporphyrin-III C-methyltransferase
VEYVPGITSALSVPGLAGIPPTFRGISTGFAVLTGHGRDGAALPWRDYARVETLIVLMGVHRRAEIAQELIGAGRSGGDPVCFIENGTTARERICISDLASVARGEVEVSPPAVFVIGGVVGVREQLLPALIGLPLSA